MKKNLFAAGLLSLLSVSAFAATGSNFPWDKGLLDLAVDLTGPVAVALGTVGGIAALGPAIFHAEIPHLSHKAAAWFLAAGGAMAVPKLVTLTGVGGALV